MQLSAQIQLFNVVILSCHASFPSISVSTIVGSRSHLVRFVNGGELRFAYDGAGDLIELKSRGLVASITPVGVIRYAVSQTQDKATT